MLGTGSLAAVVGGAQADGYAQLLLSGFGITGMLGCLIWFGQQVTSMTADADHARSRPSAPIESAVVASEPPAADAEHGSDHHEVEGPVRLYRAASAAPSITDLVKSAESEVLAMVISGRNFFQPRLQDVILHTIQDPHKSVKFKFLALNHHSGGGAIFVDKRVEMMDMRRGDAFRPMYEKDFEQVREYTAQVTVEDPTRDSFDVRYYSMMPTAYFYIIDGTLYLGSLLSKPIPSSPMITIRQTDEESRALVSAYQRHFDFYWSRSRFYVTLIGLTDDGQTLLVRNRTRALEWPTGYIEPNEDLAAGAMREFLEETGYRCGPARQISTNSMGYYFVARIGEKETEGSSREISEVVFVRELPASSDMSFPEDHRNFDGYLQKALRLLPSLDPPPEKFA